MESMYREQALANCKFLYGPTTEIITVQTESQGYQAIAIRFDRTTGTSVVHLCSGVKPDGASSQVNSGVAIRRLCKRSGREINERLCADGVDVPFSNDSIGHNSPLVLHMPVHHKQLDEHDIFRGRILEGSESDSSFADTPTSSVAGTETADDVVAEATHDDPCSIEESPTISKDEIDHSSGNKLEAQSEPAVMENTVVQEFLPQAVVQHDQIDELSSKVVAAIESQLKKVFADFKIELTTQMIEALDEKLGSVLSRKNELQSAVDTEAVSEQVVEEDDWASMGKEEKTDPKLDFQIPLPEPEAIPEPVAEEDIWASCSSKKVKKKNAKKSVIDEPEAITEPLVEDDDWGSSPSKKDKKKKGKSADLAAPLPQPEPVAEYDDWGSWSSKGKKKEGKVIDLEPSLPEPEPIPEPPPEDDIWGSFSSKKDKKKGKRVVIEEPEPEPAAELSADIILAEDRWGSFTKKDKKKKKAAVTEIIVEPEPEAEVIPVSEPEIEKFGWGSFASKKDKKKKKKVVTEPSPEPERLPSPPPEQTEDLWDFGFKKSKKSKNVKKEVLVPEEPAIPADPEPEVVYDWGFSMSKKDKKKKRGIFEFPVEEQVAEAAQVPEPEVTEGAFDWGSFARQKGKREEKEQAPTDIPLAEQEELERSCAAPESESVPEEDPWYLPPKSKKGKKVVIELPPSEQEELERSVQAGSSLNSSCTTGQNGETVVEDPTPEIVNAAYGQVTTHELVLDGDDKGIEPQTKEICDAFSGMKHPPNTTIVEQPSPDRIQSPGGMTVVLKILCRGSSGMVAVERSMIKLQENTKEGIDEAARSICLKLGYSESANSLKFDIISGVGKDGDLALKDLDDAMWPDYLEYFCTCTKIPELMLQTMGIEEDFSNLMIDD